MNAMAIDPPAFGHWGAGGGGQGGAASERSVFSSSLGSVKMMDSDSTSDSDDELEPMENDEAEDAIVNTPQLNKRHNPSATTPFANNASAISWASAFSPGGANTFPNFHRARLRNGRSRKSSSSASGASSLASPAPQSPPPGKMGGDGYFGREVNMRGPASRRESLSLHTHDLHISSGNDSGDEATKAPPTTPGVVRRAVTRRGNLLVSFAQALKLAVNTNIWVAQDSRVWPYPSRSHGRIYARRRRSQARSRSHPPSTRERRSRRYKRYYYQLLAHTASRGLSHRCSPRYPRGGLSARP